MSSNLSDQQRSASPIRVATGVVLLFVATGIGFREWGFDSEPLRAALSICVLIAFLMMLKHSTVGRLVFSVVAVALSMIVAWFSADWLQMMERSLINTAFLMAFLASMTSLGIPARNSPAILQSGQFLAKQPSGRRYAALSVGGVLFSIFLNFGSLVLLGNMTVENLKRESVERIRKIRTKRMLLAIQRAMISTIPWSPLSFAVTVVLLLVPEISWPELVLPGFFTGFLLLFLGWLVDTLFSPKPASKSALASESKGSWWSLWPLLLLLFMLSSLLLMLNSWTGVRVPGIIILLAPSMALAWLVIQQPKETRASSVLLRMKRFVTDDLPDMRSELQIMMLAGYVGSLAGQFSAPYTASLGLQAEQLSPVVVLLVLVWITAIFGQFAVHPLLAVSTMLPLLPSAAELHIAPVVLATATLAGWILASISTPFTATVVLISRYAQEPPNTVARVWNGPYALLCGVVFSIWVLLFHAFTGGV